MKLSNSIKWLVVGFTVIIILSYKFAFSRTLYYYNECLHNEEYLSKDNTNELYRLQLRKKQLDTILNSYVDRNTTSFQNDFLIKLNKLCKLNKLVLIDFKEPYVFRNGTKAIYYYIFKIQGSYNGSILLLHEIETKTNFGELIHVDFKIEKDYKLNSERLFTEVILRAN